MEAVDSGDDKAFEAAQKGWNVLDWTRIIGESGYAAPLWPKEYGGLSGEVWMQQIVREELEHYRLPTAGINILGIGLAGPTLIAHGTEEQKERYLRKILTGEEVWCQLFSEPGAGSDLAATGAKAVWTDGEWVVNGQKVWTSIAQMSKFGMLLARSDPDAPKHDGLVYFIWEGGKQRIQQPAALDDHDLDELGLTIGDPAPDDLVVGEEGSAFVMYPSDGPDSKLHLMDGDTLHELRIVATAEATVADLPDLEDLVVNRVRIR
jgi:alkylation response protein AidB-like acyl-CoA dehydrogenase